MSADQSQERIITKSCNHVKLQKLETTMTYSAVGLTAVVGTNLKVAIDGERKDQRLEVIELKINQLQNQIEPFQLL